MRRGRTAAQSHPLRSQEKLTAAAKCERIGAVGELRRFFQGYDARETRPEPDWQEPGRVIQRS
ncbi:MAG: hypothetical protein Q8N53_21980 [Longimicrobiales bacterium]|nr:hypothetical protein [Longimicrobiales bacterium]